MLTIGAPSTLKDSKMKRLITAAMALTLLAGAGAASAQPSRNQHHNAPQAQHNDNQGPQGFERRADKRYKASAYKAPRGYKAPKARRGDKLAAAYRGPSYQVDYKRYNLTAPPRGYQYVRVNNDVVLAAVATGVISSVILQMFQ